MRAGRNEPCPCGSGRKYKSCCLPGERQLDAISKSPGAGAGALPFRASAGPGADLAVIWEVDLVPLSSGLEDDPAARPGILLVMADELVVHVEVVGRAPSEPVEIAEALNRGVAAAGRRIGHLPEHLLVRYEELATALAPLLEAKEVTVEASRDLPTIDDFLMEGADQIGVGPGGLAVSVPRTWAGWGLPDSVVSEFFRAAAEFWRAAPWRWLQNEDLLHLVFEGGETAIACVLGNGGEEFGIALYADLEDFLIHTTGEPAVEKFRDLEGPLLSMTYESRSELPRAMQREVAKAGWEVADPLAYPLLMIFNTPAGGVTRSQAERMIAALRSIPPFVERFRGVITGEESVAMPVEWKDPGAGVSVEYHGMLVVGPAPLFDAPAVLEPGLATGPGAEPEAALEVPGDIDELRERELEVVDRFIDWMAGQGRSDATVTKHALNAQVFIDFLAWHRAVPLRAVTEFDLRSFLYDWYPRKVRDALTRARAVPTSLRRFFEFLTEEEGIVCLWAGPILRDRETYEIRLDEFPGGFWWDEGVNEWRGEIYSDLNARVMIHDHRLTSDDEWGSTMGAKEARLEHELERRWLLWRDEVIRSGVTDPVRVRTELVQRQRGWEIAPHKGFGGETPFEVIIQEREQREKHREKHRDLAP